MYFFHKKSTKIFLNIYFSLQTLSPHPRSRRAAIARAEAAPFPRCNYTRLALVCVPLAVDRQFYPSRYHIQNFHQLHQPMNSTTIINCHQCHNLCRHCHTFRMAMIDSNQSMTLPTADRATVMNAYMIRCQFTQRIRPPP